MRRRDKRVLQQRHGGIDEMEKEKSIPDWVLDQSAMFASQLGFMLHTRTLYTLYKVTQQALDKGSFLTKVESTSENISASITVSGRCSHSEIRNRINELFLWSGREVWKFWTNGWSFYTITVSHTPLFCVSLQGMAQTWLHQLQTIVGYRGKKIPSQMVFCATKHTLTQTNHIICACMYSMTIVLSL